MPRTPAKKAGRPALPLNKLNPHLNSIPKENFVVKYQTIVREEQEIVVGRVKVPTPQGHAFILRRYDTGAFSQTTIFKACFPTASEDEERAECDWVKGSADNAGANGGRASDAVRLAGTWVMPEVAIQTALAYGVSDLIQALADAAPDPSQNYRKSQRSQAASEGLSAPAPAKASSTTGLTPNPKRTRVSPRSPTPADGAAGPSSDPAAPPAYSALPAGTHVELEVDVPKPVVDAAEQATAQRLKAEFELEQSRKLVAQLKAAEDAKKAAVVAAAQDVIDAEPDAATITKVAAKRAIDDVAAEDDGSADKEEQTELEEGRQIATNARANRPPPAGGAALQTFKQAAWGALVFGVGVGATTILPRFFF